MAAAILNSPSAINPVIQPVEQEAPLTCCDKIWNVVKGIFKVLLGAALLVINSTLFVAGFLIGIIWNEKSKEAIERIKAAWNKQPWHGTALIIAGGILALPATLAASSTLYALHVGSTL